MTLHTILNIIGWTLLIITWTSTGWIKNYKTKFFVRMVLSAIALMVFIGAMSITISEYINK